SDDAHVQRRAIGGDVVRDELAEEWPPRRVRSERGVGILGIFAVAQPAGPPEREEKRFIRLEGREIGKEARGTGTWGRIRGSADARGSETVRVIHGGILAAACHAGTTCLGRRARSRRSPTGAR